MSFFKELRHFEFFRMKVFFVTGLLFIMITSCAGTDPAKTVEQIRMRGDFHAGTRELEYKDQKRNRNLKLTLWYPTIETSEQIRYLAFKGYAKKDAAIAQGNFPLIIISHGTGSHRYAQFYMAEFLASNGYMVASIEHARDNAFDDKDSRTATNLWNRPKDVSFILDRILSEYKMSINQDKIGMIGHSIGGYTAFVIAGAVPDPDRLAAYCETHGEDDYMCYKAEKEKKSIYRSKDLTTLSDGRIKAIFVMAPALGQAFGKQDMKRVEIPVFMVASGNDDILPEPFNIQQYLKTLPKAPEFHEFPKAGHFVYLAECPMLVKLIAMTACRDSGTPRSEIHPKLRELSLSFFRHNL